MPGNKIGKLKAGQGLRRILAQRRGGWTHGADHALSFEIGSELRPEKPPTDRPSRSSRYSGANKSPKGT